MLSHLPEDEYRALPGLSGTRVRTLLRSPAHYLAQEARPSEPSAAMALGTAIHCAVLEPDRFGGLYVAQPEGDGRTKEVRDARAAIAARGQTPLAAADMAACREIARLLHEHPIVGPWLRAADAEFEGSVTWDAWGCPAKGRLDLAVPSAGIVADVKTCRDARPSAFARDVAQYGYHVQAAWYLAGLRACHGIEPAWHWIAVESEPPHGVRVYRASAADLADGATACQLAAATWVEMQTSGAWCYPLDVVELSRPGWADRQETENDR